MNIPKYNITTHDSLKLSAMCFLRSSKGSTIENPYHVHDVVSINNSSGVGTVCAGLGEYLLVALLRYDRQTKAYAHTGETVVTKATDVQPFTLHDNEEEIVQHGMAAILRAGHHV
jgi:hypothetical protein